MKTKSSLVLVNFFILLLLPLGSTAQTFTRTVLTGGLNRPWEMLYGPDNMLWITQTNGRVSRIDPNTGTVNTIYTAPDYFDGSPSQSVILHCNPDHSYSISKGTYGLALHPDFVNSPYVYFIYSYNSGSTQNPVSNYKVRRLKWNANSRAVSEPTDIISDLPLDLSHEGMRMVIVSQFGTPYIYITTGDGTIDDDRCYPEGNNGNLRAQDWNSRFGKILRYNIDGSIPASNPINNSPVYTKGHRNPLGLAYNPATGILYSSENGKSTDDELNIIESGKNYGWPRARGYHTDNNYPGEAAFVSEYTPSFPNDKLKQAIYSWCNPNVILPEDPQPVGSTCSVAPSDMIYYPHAAIPEFQNSLLVTTLKNYNPNFRASVYVFKLNSNGTALDNTNPNPLVYFSVPDNAAIPNSEGELRYRDITISPDGKTIFISTDTWAGQNNQILKFTYNEGSSITTYYPKTTATDLSITTNWTTDVAGGTGNSPSDFLSANQLLNINNNFTNPTIRGVWTISGGTGLVINNPNGLTFTPSARLNIGEGSVVNFNNRNVVLKSDINSTASIGTIKGTLINATNVTVERFITSLGNRAYRLLTPSVNTATTIFENWQENGSSAAGYGTHITGSATGANGFDATQTGQPSLFTYNSAILAWDPAANTNATLLSGKKGYLLFLRGDRTLNLSSSESSSPSNNTTLRATGSLLTGPQVFNDLIGNNGFSLISNPYASSINWAGVYEASTNLSKYYTTWDPKVGSRGGYVTVRVDGSKSNLASDASGNIQSGQAFFIQAAGDNKPIVNILESHKTEVNKNAFRVDNNVAKFYSSLYSVDSFTNRKNVDGVLSIYNNQKSDSLDTNDADQIPNWDEDIAIVRARKMLSIENRPLIVETDTIIFATTRLKVQNYEWQFDGINFNGIGLQAYLFDKFLDSKTFINLSGKTSIPFAITSDAKSSAEDRFMVVFDKATVLPVYLSELRANETLAGIQLEWSVLTETNIEKFEVEKSIDGQQFLMVASVAANRSSAGPVVYKWTDNKLNNRNIYYRIKHISTTRAEQYTNVVRVGFGKAVGQIEIYPNPIKNNTLTLHLSNLKKNRLIITLVNSKGQQVFRKTFDHKGGQVTQTLDIGNIVSGLYQLKVVGGDEIFTKKVIKY